MQNVINLNMCCAPGD